MSSGPAGSPPRAGVARRGLYVAPFDEMADPNLLARLAEQAEAAGWHGFFLWDHVSYRAPTRALLDPWVALSAIACATEHLRLGPLVVSPARRRIQKLARETVTKALAPLAARRAVGHRQIRACELD